MKKKCHVSLYHDYNSKMSDFEMSGLKQTSFFCFICFISY